MISVKSRNPSRLICGEQRALRQIKSNIEKSKDKLFLTKHTTEGSERDKWYLLQFYMDSSDPYSMSNYGVYGFQWYIRQYDNCTKHPTTECHFWPKIIVKNQYGMLGKMFPVRPSKLHNLLQNNHTCVW